MPTIKRFEDLEIWQKARELNNQIIKICASPLLSKDFEMVRHIKKTYGSIMDNIAEGFERTGNVEFRQFLSISKGSTGELKSQLYRCIDSNYFGESEFEEMYKLTDEISKMISSFINYLNNSELRGNKFKKQF
jgi:four helix bundle protein